MSNCCLLIKTTFLDELRATITNAIHEITWQQLENIFNKLKNRIGRCIMKDGGYVEA